MESVRFRLTLNLRENMNAWDLSLLGSMMVGSVGIKGGSKKFKCVGSLRGAVFSCRDSRLPDAGIVMCRPHPVCLPSDGSMVSVWP